MTDTLDALQEIKRTVADKERAKAKREADIDHLKARIRQDVERMKNEFGVASVEEARTKLADMERELDAEVQRARQLLEEAQA